MPSSSPTLVIWLASSEGSFPTVDNQCMHRISDRHSTSRNNLKSVQSENYSYMYLMFSAFQGRWLRACRRTRNFFFSVFLSRTTVSATSTSALFRPPPCLPTRSDVDGFTLCLSKVEGFCPKIEAIHQHRQTGKRVGIDSWFPTSVILLTVREGVTHDVRIVFEPEETVDE